MHMWVRAVKCETKALRNFKFDPVLKIDETVYKQAEFLWLKSSIPDGFARSQQWWRGRRIPRHIFQDIAPSCLIYNNIVRILCSRNKDRLYHYFYGGSLYKFLIRSFNDVFRIQEYWLLYKEYRNILYKEYRNTV